MSFDERIVPARKDIAADFLKNKHKSQKFVSGIKKEVIFPKKKSRNVGFLRIESKLL